MYLYINQEMPSVQYLNDNHTTLIPVSDNALRFNIKLKYSNFKNYWWAPMKFCIAWEGQSYKFKMFTMNAANHSVQHTLMHNKLATDMTMNLIFKRFFTMMSAKTSWVVVGVVGWGNNYYVNINY